MQMHNCHRIYTYIFLKSYLKEKLNMILISLYIKHNDIRTCYIFNYIKK